MTLWLANVGKVILPSSKRHFTMGCVGQVKLLNTPCELQAWRLPTVRQAQVRHSSVFSEFKKKVQEELDRSVHSCHHAYHAATLQRRRGVSETNACCCSNPALKQSVEELKQKTGSLMERYYSEQQWHATSGN